MRAEVRLTPGDFERKLEAVRCHGSQLSSLQREWPDLLDPAGPLARERFGQAGTRRECHLAVPGRLTAAPWQIRRSGHPAGVTATTTLAEGEAVLWRERRSPPFMEAAIAVALVLAVAGVAVANVVATPLLLAAAVGAVLLGPARRRPATTSRISC